MAEDVRIQLSDMIEDLRHELQEAASKGAGQDLVFEIEKAELEAKVVVSKSGTGDAKVQFWVVSAGGAYEQKGETTHTVNLTLLPKSSKTGERTLVSGESARKPSGK
jgi:Trypsin-co-occurring domain 2